MPPSPSELPDRTRRLGWVDLVACLALAGLAAYIRRDSYPSDGLWLDDAWVAVAARAPFSDLLTVSWNHPGFTFLVQVVNSLHPGRVEVLAWPTLAMGVLSVPLLYVSLRRLGLHAVACAPVGVVVALNRTHAIYSGRVKPYVFEVAGITLLALGVHALARRRWRWPVAAAWLAFALVVSTISAFAFAAAAVATLVLTVHASGDRPIRLAVLGVQGALQLASGLLTRSRYDAAEVADLWETHYDAYIDLGEGPVDVARQIARHVVRLAETWVELPAALAVAVLGLAVAGLVLASVRGPRTVVARFLAILPAVAFAGSLVAQVPFAPTPDTSVFPGSRGSMWLYPSLGFGTAVALHEGLRFVRSRAGRTEGADRWRRAPAAAVALVLAATVAFFTVKVDVHPVYGVLGDRTATAFVEAERRDGEPVFFLEHTRYIVAAQPPLPLTIRSDPDRIEGFTPIIGNGRVAVPQRPGMTLEHVGELVGDSRRVFVHNAFIGFGGSPALEELLGQLGFELVRTEEFDGNSVQIWSR